MDITNMHAVTPDEASYKVTKALLPFLIEAGTPVYICRDGWALAAASSIGGPPTEATKEYHDEDWRTLADAMMTYAHASGKFVYTTAIVVPKGYALEPPPNWKDLVYALTVLQVIIGAEGWERAIHHESGEIFVVDLERTQRGAVQIVY